MNHLEKPRLIQQSLFHRKGLCRQCLVSIQNSLSNPSTCPQIPLRLFTLDDIPCDTPLLTNPLLTDKFGSIISCPRCKWPTQRHKTFSATWGVSAPNLLPQPLVQDILLETPIGMVSTKHIKAPSPLYFKMPVSIPVEIPTSPTVDIFHGSLRFLFDSKYNLNVPHRELSQSDKRTMEYLYFFIIGIGLKLALPATLVDIALDIAIQTSLSNTSRRKDSNAIGVAALSIALDALKATILVEKDQQTSPRKSKLEKSQSPSSSQTQTFIHPMQCILQQLTLKQLVLIGNCNNDEVDRMIEMIQVTERGWKFFHKSSQPQKPNRRLFSDSLSSIKLIEKLEKRQSFPTAVLSVTKHMLSLISTHLEYSSKNLVIPPLALGLGVFYISFQNFVQYSEKYSLDYILKIARGKLNGEVDLLPPNVHDQFLFLRPNFTPSSHIHNASVVALSTEDIKQILSNWIVNQLVPLAKNILFLSWVPQDPQAQLLIPPIYSELPENMKEMAINALQKFLKVNK